MQRNKVAEQRGFLTSGSRNCEETFPIWCDFQRIETFQTGKPAMDRSAESSASTMAGETDLLLPPNPEAPPKDRWVCRLANAWVWLICWVSLLVPWKSIFLIVHSLRIGPVGWKGSRGGGDPHSRAAKWTAPGLTDFLVVVFQLWGRVRCNNLFYYSKLTAASLPKKSLVLIKKSSHSRHLPALDPELCVEPFER